jgi:phosphatidylcholine synthase
MPWNLISAWLVHLYTGLGVVVGFLSLLRIEQRDFRSVFFLMAVAIVLDATDGTLARAARVKELIPWFDGDTLDGIVDYFNYVIVPVLLLFRADLLPPDDALWLAMFPLLASAYGFSQKNAKTADNFFLGFPSYWNIVVFYLYVLGTPHWLNAFLLIALAGLVFVPMKYIYPSRSPYFRVETNALGALWAVCMLYLVYRLPDAPRFLVFASLIFPAYYTALSLWLEFRRLRGSS